MNDTTAQKPSLLSSLLRRLYVQKILTFAVLLFLISIVLFVAAFYVEEHKEWVRPWILFVPLHSLGDACFVAAIVGFVYEWIVREESEKKLEETISGLLSLQNATIVQSFRETIITDPAIVARVFRGSERKKIIRAVLEADNAGDNIGKELYEASISRVATYDERWQNYRCSATLTKIDDPKIADDVKDIFFHCYYDIRYDTVLRARKLLFACVPTIEEYNEKLVDKECELVWLFPVAQGQPFSSESGFVASNVRVGSLMLNVQPENREEHGVTYVADHPLLATQIGKTVSIQYRIDVRVKRRGHLISLNFVYPTKNISMEIDVSNTDIKYITARDFFASTVLPRIRYVPSPDVARKISVDIEGWVFPKGGVDFIWTLQSESRTQ